MVCTRCHHVVHRQGWGIEIDGGRVSFIPTPSIDPDLPRQPGGLADLEIDVSVARGDRLDDHPPPRLPTGIPPDLWLPPITPADLALVRRWETQARALEAAHP